MKLADEAEMAAVGQRLAAVLSSGDVIALSGPLGVGKTTLTRAMLAALGHQGDVPSPTFAIVQPYDDLVPPVWHVDLFRVEDRGEIDELGLESDVAALIVEWPERAGPEAWPEALQLRLDFAEDGARSLTANLPPTWRGRWPFP